METKFLLDRYSYYYDFLQKLAGYPLAEHVTLDDLKPSRGVAQAGYKEMKSENFDGSLTDYLCLISTRYILHLAKAYPGSPADFVVEKHSDYKEDVINLLRLFNKNPWHFLGSYDEDSYLKLSLLWYQLYNRKIGSD